jgi:GTP-binding protein
MKINKAIFLQSNVAYQNCPSPDKPEYAFIGRSNVGKSSLINMITSQANLAKTSQMPGKTQLINHFLIDDSWYLVDLPGYGYAQVGKAERDRWDKMIRSYLENRPNLFSTFVLLDSRHPAQAIDLAFMEYMGEAGLPFAIVFTKADKQSATQTRHNLEQYSQKLLENWESLPPIFVTSAANAMGKEELIAYIIQLNGQYLQLGIPPES